MLFLILHLKVPQVKQRKNQNNERKKHPRNTLGIKATETLRKNQRIDKPKNLNFQKCPGKMMAMRQR